MVLEFKNIVKSFGEKQVLKGISFAAESGKAFGLLGRNGAGKTTSIRILMGVFPADEGEILVDGKPIDYASVGMGYLPEERGLYPKKKVIDQLVYFAMLKIVIFLTIRLLSPLIYVVSQHFLSFFPPVPFANQSDLYILRRQLPWHLSK